MTDKLKSKRGFACLTPERRREIARKGGSMVPADKRSYSQNKELAQASGRKGGSISRGGGRKPKGG